MNGLSFFASHLVELLPPFCDLGPLTPAIKVTRLFALHGTCRQASAAGALTLGDEWEHQWSHHGSPPARTTPNYLLVSPPGASGLQFLSAMNFYMFVKNLYREKDKLPFLAFWLLGTFSITC